MSLIVDRARDYLGVKFKHQGRNTAGLDCVGLAIRVLNDCGYAVDDQQGYARNPTGVLEGAIKAQPSLSKVKECEAGDFLLMRIGREQQHVAIRTDKGIIHSYETVGKVVEHGFSHAWQRRVSGVYRVIDNV